MNYAPLLNSVSKDLLPSEGEQKQLLSEVKSFLLALNSEIKKNNISAKAVLGGSYAKGTWLAGDYDVDIFVKFAKKHWPDDLSLLLAKAMRKFKPELIHGSRDYFWVRNKIKFEIVPVFDIKKSGEAQNVTDFSPLHVGWVNKKGKKLKNDIRLAKKFCKAAGCYGAESCIRGFSGHVADILVIYYKGFLHLLRAAKNWKQKVIIDYNKFYKGNALLMMNKSKCEGPLIVVDPVQPGRNAAAALTQENFDKFVEAAKSFLAKPGKSFFDEKQVDFVKLERKGHLLKVSVATVDAKEDVAGAKFVAAFNHVKSALADFQVSDSGWLWDRKKDGVWWFLLKKNKLPETFELRGPPLTMKKQVQKFKKAHKSTFNRSKFIWTKLKRSSRTPEQVVTALANSEFIKLRVSKVKI